VCRGEGEEAYDGVFQFVSVAIFLTLAGLSSEGTLGRPPRGCLLGAHLLPQWPGSAPKVQEADGAGFAVATTASRHPQP